VHLNTGRPESGDLTSTTEVPNPENTNWTQVSLDQVHRLPAFYRVDVRAEKSWAFDDFVLDVYLDVLNATVNWEVVSYTYENNSTLTSNGLLKVANSVPVVVPTLGVRATY
jgi:hypothetical protein